MSETAIIDNFRAPSIAGIPHSIHAMQWFYFLSSKIPLRLNHLHTMPFRRFIAARASGSSKRGTVLLASGGSTVPTYPSAANRLVSVRSLNFLLHWHHSIFRFTFDTTSSRDRVKKECHYVGDVPFVITSCFQELATCQTAISRNQPIALIMYCWPDVYFYEVFSTDVWRVGFEMYVNGSYFLCLKMHEAKDCEMDHRPQ